MDLFNDPSSARCPASDTVLLYEYTHRVSNEFTSAISAISIAAARSTNDEVKASLAAVGELLRNYARVHNALRMPERATDIDVAAYLGRLCLAISRSKLDRKGIELVFVGRPLMVSSECGWRLGMIVSELVTNAVRHAFREHGGVIKIELIASKSSVECHVTDNGTSEGDIRPGHGFRIVEALARGLNGRIVQHFGPRGATSVLSFPYAPDPVEQPTTPSSARPQVETSNPYPRASSRSRALSRD